MYITTKVLAILTAVVFLAGGQDPYAVAPKNYRLEFENDSVRVSRALFAPGDKLPVHNHPANPTVFVYLTDGGPIRFTHVEPAFTVEREAVQAGGIRFHTGATETHIVEYLGDAPSQYLRIELKTERPSKKTQHIRIAADEPGPFENGQLRISRFQCPAQSQCAAPEFRAVVVTLNDRSVAWYEAGQAFRNEGSETARQVRGELKTKPLAVVP